MSLLKQAPRFSVDEAAALVRDLYALEGSLAPLPSERDQNFLVKTDDARFVLKIANAAEERAILDAQNAAMRHVAAHTALCPHVIATTQGAEIAQTAGHFVRLLSWVPGVPLGTLRWRSSSLLADLGRRIGEIDAALASFDHPAIHRDFYWDLANGPRIIRQRRSLIADGKLRALVDGLLASVEEHGRTFAEVRRSAIHNDVNDYNVIVTPADDVAGKPRVAGLVDFGDIIYGLTVADAAIAIAYAMLGAADPLSAAAAVVRGYQSSYPLDDAELHALFPLVKLRLCMSVCIAADQQRDRPDDGYLAISQQPIRNILPAVAAIDDRRAADVFRTACDRQRTLARRRASIGPSVRLSYTDPLRIVRGSMQYLYDDTGRRYIDAYNNVPHVGHCHPRIVAAADAQTRLLNTNTRYLHDSLVRLAERLIGTLPAPLRVCYFVNSGSEANELAVRLARAYTGARDTIVLDSAYHGNTTTLIEMSPYKFNGPGGEGRRPWIHVVPIPDVYRGAYKHEAEAGVRYAAHVAGALREIQQQGRAVAAYLAETCPSVGGQIVFPPGYLQAVYAHVRAAGGVCIADEVQTAYGRMGTAFYAFEDQRVVPDIVVLGKPIGNGHPVGAVVTTDAIASAFDNGMEFFSTFGGSTVSCAIALAVLDVVQSERLQTHARAVGDHLIRRLRTLMDRHPIIGDVRGSGLFLGLELVRDPRTLDPAAEEASFVVERMREQGILLGTDGPFHNVIKIRPPMPFNLEDADTVAWALDEVLGSVPAPV